MSNNRVTWLSTSDPPDSFPPVSAALREPDGLLAAGGSLQIERLLYAYRHGIFPWYEDGQPLLWWSPDPRCVFLPGDYHVSRRLRRELRCTSAEIRVNTAFADVIRACAGPRRSEQGTWITADMIRAYQQLHESGWAHSIEVWRAGQLCGGLYGLVIGRVFFGESMFSEIANASKMALLYLARSLDSGEIEMLDCQVSSAHLLSLGARMIPRSEFTELLETGCNPVTPLQNWPGGAVGCPDLLPE